MTLFVRIYMRIESTRSTTNFKLHIYKSRSFAGQGNIVALCNSDDWPGIPGKKVFMSRTGNAAVVVGWD